MTENVVCYYGVACPGVACIGLVRVVVWMAALQTLVVTEAGYEFNTNSTSK